MNATLNFGDKFSYNADWTGEEFCAVCNKELKGTALELCLDVNDRIITPAEYNESYEANLVLVGSTCASKFAKGVVA